MKEPEEKKILSGAERQKLYNERNKALGLKKKYIFATDEEHEYLKQRLAELRGRK